jgi:hypothetical protein
VGDFKSFSAPLLNLHDSHIVVPWFGPNAWQALVQPVLGGNLPATSTGIELKLTFKEGGAPDFHSNFERIKERLQEALATSGQPHGRDGFLSAVNLDTVHLDQLPTYEASGQDRVAPDEPSPILEPLPAVRTQAHAPSTSRTVVNDPPSDAPPGYEETQQHSIQQEVERRLSGH